MYCISISHKTAPINVRELFSFTQEEQVAFGKIVLQESNISGCVIVSTCNRSEIYFSGEDNAVFVMERIISKYKNINKEDRSKYCHIYSDKGAIKHLFRVTCGLDSMVLGEDEILRQVKESYIRALENNITSNELNMVFQGALNSSKLIKTDTKFSKTPVSIGTLTANEVINFLQKNKAQNVLIVGVTGKIGSIVAKNLSCKEGINIVGTSRKHNTYDESIIDCQNIRKVNYEERYKYLEEADVIVSATTSPHYTFTFNEVSKILQANRKNRLFIDLAVPGDIDVEIRTIKEVEVLNIDYFEKAAEKNNLIKLKEIDKVELILSSKVDETLKNIYFQEFNNHIEEVVKNIEDNGLNNMIYKLKDSLDSEQLKAVLDTLRNMAMGGK